MHFPLAVNPSNASVGAHLEVARNVAWLERKDLGQRWIATYGQLVAYGASFADHGDIRTDLLLRSLEAETSRRLNAREEVFDETSDIQGTLSRYWILSIYEMVRVAKESPKGKTNSALNAFYRRLRLIRVPLGKLEIAFGNKAKGLELLREGDDPLLPGRIYSGGEGWEAQYRPLTFVRLDSGSLGWSVVDAPLQTMVEITRQELSDELLKLFD